MLGAWLSVSRDQQTPPLTATSDVTNLPRSGGILVTTSDGRTVYNTR